MYGGQRNCSIGQSDSRDLIFSSAGSPRSHLDSAADDVSDGERYVTHNQPGCDLKGRVQNQPQNCGADAENQTTNKTAMAVGRQVMLHAFTARGAGHALVDA